MEVSSSKKKQNLNQSALKLGELVIDSDNYRFIPHNPNDNSSTTIQNFSNLAWLVYKGKMFPEKNRQYKLSEGDVIKIGNVVLLIKDIHIQKRILKEENIEFDHSRYHNNNLYVVPKRRIKCNNETCSNTAREENIKELKNCTFQSDKHSIFKKGIALRPYPYRMDNINTFILNNASSTVKPLFNKSKYFNTLDYVSHKSTTLLKLQKRGNRKKKMPICRLCFEEEDCGEQEIINPLIEPCSCSGSLKLIHVKCLRKWVAHYTQGNSLSKRNLITTIQFPIKKIKCKLCKEIIPELVKHKGKLYNLYDTPINGSEIRDKCIIFESINNPNNKIRYIVPFSSQNKITIGKGRNVQLSLDSDPYVSDNHCVISIEKGNNVLLEDVNSKYGTLVMLQCPYVDILRNQPLAMQIGSSFMNISIKSSSSFFCCGVSEINGTDSYEKMNRKFVSFENFIYIKEDMEYEEGDLSVYSGSESSNDDERKRNNGRTKSKKEQNSNKETFSSCDSNYSIREDPLGTCRADGFLEIENDE